MSFKEFARGAVVIGLAQALTGLGNFLLLPLITKTLGTNDYGLWVQILVTVTLLSHIVLLQQHMALLRFLSSKTDKREIREEFSTILSYLIVVGFAVAIIIMLVVVTLRTVTTLFNEEGIIQPLVLAAFLVPFTAFGALTTSFFMASGRFKVYSALLVLNSFGQLILTLVLLSFGLGLLGVVTAALMINVLVFSIAMFLIVRNVGICRPRWHLLRPNLKFSLPLTPGALISWVTDSSDRYLVAFILGLSLAGIYSAAYGIAAVVFLLISPIQIVLYPTISRLYDNNEMDEVRSYLSRSLRYFLMIAIPAVAGMAVLAEPLLVSLTTPEFAPGAPVIPLVALAGLLSGVLAIITSILYLVKKTHLNLIVFTVPAVVNVVLVLILTPTIGIIGAALATTIAYALMVLIGGYLSARYIRFSADVVFVAKSTASACLMVGIIVLIGPYSLVDILLAISAGIAAYFVSLFLIKGMTHEELDLIRSLIRVVSGRGRNGPSDTSLDDDNEGRSQ